MSNISDLRFDDKNMNAHTAKGMGMLEKSLQQFGAGRSILIDKNNRIIGGNGVVEAAGNIGLEDVQIVESDGKKIIAVKRTDIDLDSKEGRELAMADNAVAAEDLSWDKGNIEEVSEQFGIDPGDWISDWDPQTEQEVVEDEAPEVNEIEPAKSELGKVYQLGEHRLMCGDSTDAGSVAILMDGQKADMVFTDPPYGMNLDTDYSGMRSEIFKGGIGGKKYEQGIVDDFNPKMIDMILKINAKETFIWGADYFAELLTNRNNGSWVVWDKRANNNGDIEEDYSSDKMYGSCFELCWSKNRHKRDIARVKWAGIFGMSNQDQNKRFHPTQKPLELCSWFIKKYSNERHLIVDLFGGSGSTLIACEQLGRKCYMMELDPKYCDVIRKRYWKFTHDGNEEGWEEGTPAIGGEDE